MKYEKRSNFKFKRLLERMRSLTQKHIKNHLVIKNGLEYLKIQLKEELKNERN